MRKPSIYVIGSLRNSAIPEIANALQDLGYDAFAEWYAAGPDADDCWKTYEMARGRTYLDALQGHAAKHVFEFDRLHLERCDMAVLVMPAGRSGHLELGWMAGRGKPTFVLLDAAEASEARWDVMTLFAGKVFLTRDEFLRFMQQRRTKCSTSW